MNGNMDINGERHAITVEISDTQSHLRVGSEFLTMLVRNVLVSEAVKRASISLALVDDATIQDVNRRHLGHDQPTDVISFGLSEPGDEELIGAVVVSAEMAASIAAETAGVDPFAELALYVVHGLLHLCGYGDKSQKEVDAIRRREAEIMALAGLPHTYPLTRLATAGDAGLESAQWLV